MGERETKGLPATATSPRPSPRVGNACTHTFTEARKRPAMWGGVVQEQCVKCGRKVGSQIPMNAFDQDVLNRIPYWEPNKRPNARRRKYLEYLKTSSWKNLRKKRLEADGYVCTAQLPGCSVEATDCHHKTYARLGHEYLSDLQSLCESCHRSIDGKAG